MKKIISLILVLALALCLVPVLAEEEAADEEASELVLMSHEDYVLAEILVERQDDHLCPERRRCIFHL